jgi:hypothetical protein
MAPCPTVLTFESALFLAAKQCINNGESETAAAKKKKKNNYELLPIFLHSMSSCVVQYELRPRWPLGEEYSEGRSVARSMKTARVHPSLTSMIQGSLQK